MEPIRVVIAGIRGKMGREAVLAVTNAKGMTLVAGIDRPRTYTEASVASADVSFPIYTDPSLCFVEQKPDVYVDLTDAKGAQSNALAAVEAGVRPVIGATGLDAEFLQMLDQELQQAELGGLFAPNFAIGALLMMRMSALIAPFLPDIEIIEYHHATKKDSPSGTAKKTAEEIARALIESGKEVPPIPIHSVRLPGFVAHQEVIFGGNGEHLTIRHDSMSRVSFMPGILLGIQRVMNVVGLVNGLEHFLF
ncbi:4-hydroxy-tetrahydrodipicolinate reductase [Sulfoacidibacillus thermotolerans]|uniref:4-hydroxy-tetrahydrodipicolinate reductase n=1 Tax=Sulfoacidibacillus thermotolerans TaxID=1765684 RepID=A0A2U3D712_SULT2|nr:4-hydroxy-tetrahydrodipicolinate reductase [Sulfoacidibacillus thermotolerans]PWI57067.1 4-hydroxy-tetrahydrodipicolinate reductase [Sulfoacidibacillus thermotolerans]